MPVLKGSCLCGRVRYEFAGKASDMINCHCSMCRKSHGSAFATLLATDPQEFRWISGEDHLGHYGDEIRRSFCSLCGSIMPFAHQDQTTIPAGTLTVDCASKIIRHIFTASKAPWYEINDAIPIDQGPEHIINDDSLPAITGSCLCDAVQFRLTGDPLLMMNCHCSRCRRSRSAAHATNLFVNRADFEWLRGETSIQRYKLPEASRFGSAFCTTCGSLMPHHGTERVNIPAGCLDVDPGTRPAAHIYIASKANWYDPRDELPKFEQGRT